jgi:hypothetical protein
MGEIGEVLVPFDSGAHVWRFHVELGVMEADIGPDQGFDASEETGINAEITKRLVAFEGVVESPGDGFSIERFRLQLHYVFAAAAERRGDQGVCHLVQSREGRAIEQGGQEEVAAAAVLIKLLWSQGVFHHIRGG